MVARYKRYIKLRSIIKENKISLSISLLGLVVFIFINYSVYENITFETNKLIDDVAKAKLSKEILFLESYLYKAEYDKIESLFVLGRKDVSDINNTYARLRAIWNRGKANDYIVNKAIIHSIEGVVAYKETSEFKGLLTDKCINDYISRVTGDLGSARAVSYFKNEMPFYTEMVYIRMSEREFIMFVYDIDMVKLQEEVAEFGSEGSGYITLTREDGFLVLHPDIGRIGTSNLKALTNINLYDDFEVIKNISISSYLGLEIVSYSRKIKISNNYFLFSISYPASILEESFFGLGRYMSIFFMIALFMLVTMILVYLYRLKKEIEQIKEREKLTVLNEKYQKENALLQLNQLKKQINPHFLFNSLNSLHILIDEDKEVSQDFVIKLSNVYRYMLEYRKDSVVPLAKELEFCNHYFFLHKIRFGDSLNISIADNVESDESVNKDIPVLSLQILIENAIKHNVVSKDSPLLIEVKIENGCLRVKNNYNPRVKQVAKGYYVGLNYIENNYNYFNKKGFEYGLKEGFFIVNLPLLNQKTHSTL